MRIFCNSVNKIPKNTKVTEHKVFESSSEMPRYIYKFVSPCPIAQIVPPTKNATKEFLTTLLLSEFLSTIVLYSSLLTKTLTLIFIFMNIFLPKEFILFILKIVFIFLHIYCIMSLYNKKSERIIWNII